MAFGTLIETLRVRTAGQSEAEVDAALVERLSALSENEILSFFWTVANRTYERLSLLLHLTRVVLKRPHDWDFARVRREHEQRGDHVRVARDRCFACEFQGQLYLHHVIEVQNGGSNTPRNLVPLCFPCHQFLHPWLKDEPAATSSKKGFESIWEISERKRRDR